MPPTFIAIATCDRPAQLRRALDSILEPVSAASMFSIVVADDSARQEGRLEARQVCLAASDKGCTPIYYLNRDDRIGLVGDLGLQNREAQSLLPLVLGSRHLGPTFGATQNLLRMFTKGCHVLHIDDDICTPVVSFPFPDDEPTIDHPEVILSPLFSEIEGRITKSYGYEKLLSRCRSIVQNEFRESTTAIVSIGLFGDSGMSTPMSIITPANPLTYRYTSSSDYIYRQAIIQRRILKHAVRESYQPLGPFMTAAYFVDNQLDFPPMLPTFRGSDAILGRMLGHEFPSYRICYLNAALSHEPNAPRSYAPFGHYFGFASVVTALMDHAQAAQPRDGASAFASFVELDPDCFSEILITAMEAHSHSEMRRLQRYLAGPGQAPPSRANDIVRLINLLATRITSQVYEIEELGDLRAASQVVQSELKAWLAGCRVWSRAAVRALDIDRERYRLRRCGAP